VGPVLDPWGLGRYICMGLDFATLLLFLLGSQLDNEIQFPRTCHQNLAAFFFTITTLLYYNVTASLSYHCGTLQGVCPGISFSFKHHLPFFFCKFFVALLGS